MVLILAVNFAATIIVNVMWNNLWERMGGEENETEVWMEGPDAEHFSKVYNREVDRISDLLIKYFMIILILGFILITGSYLIYKGSFDLGERQRKMARTGYIMLIVWMVAFHFLGTFGSVYSRGFFKVLGSIAFAFGLILPVVNLVPGNRRRLLFAGGAIFILGRTLGSLLYQWAAIAGSVVAAAGTLILILGYFIALREIGRSEFPADRCDGAERRKDLDGAETFFVVDETSRTAGKDERRKAGIDELARKLNISGRHSALLYDAGYVSREDLRSATAEELAIVDGMDPETAGRITEAIRKKEQTD